MSTGEVSGVVNSGRRATEPVVPGKGAKTKPLEHDKRCWPRFLPPLSIWTSRTPIPWKRTVHFGRPDLLEVCANSDSPLIQAVETAGGEGLRTSLWNGYDLTTRRGRERLYLFCSAKPQIHNWFSSPCKSNSSISGAVPHCVSRIVDGIAALSPRLQALGCHVHFEQQLGAHC